MGRDGLFKAEMDEFFTRELAEDGYSGLIVRKSKTCEVIIIATRPSQVLGKKPDESENSPPLLTNDGVMSKVRSISTSNESPTEACPRLPKPNLSDTNSSEVSLSDEPPTVSSDSSWNKAPEVAKSSFPVKSEDNELKV